MKTRKRKAENGIVSGITVTMGNTELFRVPSDGEAVLRSDANGSLTFVVRNKDVNPAVLDALRGEAKEEKT